MIHNRITVLQDRPDPALLIQYNLYGFRVFLEKSTGLYYLQPPDENSPNIPFQNLYDAGILKQFKTYKTSFLKDLKRENPTLLKHTLLHNYIIEEALSVSEIFQTKVLSAYSNDEDCDFVAVAENGKLLRLRIKVGRKQGKRVSRKLSESIETEISATRIYTDSDVLEEDEGVFEYVAYEALQSETEPLQLVPYWTYYEGEIQGEVIFKTLMSTPEDIAPNLMFRNVYVEFLEVFGKPAPDFSDPNAGFELIDSFIPTFTPLQKFWNILKTIITIPILLLGFLIKQVLKLLKIESGAWDFTRIGIALFFGSAIIYGAFFKSEPETPVTWKDQCEAIGGWPVHATTDICEVGQRYYNKFNLPGQKGEIRKLAVKVGANKMSCISGQPEMCLMVENGAFPGEIESYNHIEGTAQLLIVDRVQHCDPFKEGDCTDPLDIFTYTAIKQFKVPASKSEP